MKPAAAVVKLVAKPAAKPAAKVAAAKSGANSAAAAKPTAKYSAAAEPVAKIADDATPAAKARREGGCFKVRDEAYCRCEAADSRSVAKFAAVESHNDACCLYEARGESRREVSCRKKNDVDACPLSCLK